MGRESMPARRRSENTSLRFSGMDVEVQVGYYDDGRVGEVFMSTRKHGTTLDILLRDTALLISIALQYGATLEELSKSAIRKEDGAADGIISILHEHLKNTIPAVT